MPLLLFDSQGGSVVPVQDVRLGNFAKRPKEPFKPGFIFKGWFKTKTCKDCWKFETSPMFENLTLWAGWRRLAGARVALPATFHTCKARIRIGY